MEKAPFSLFLCIGLFLLAIFLIVACRPAPTESFQWDGGVVRLDRIHDSLSFIRYEHRGRELSSWRLPYPVYRFDWGDINADGVPEIAVGVIKPTRSLCLISVYFFSNFFKASTSALFGSVLM